jgi:hypothetical protein
MGDLNAKLLEAIKGARERLDAAKRAAEAKRREELQRAADAIKQENAWNNAVGTVIRISVDWVSGDAVRKGSPLCIGPDTEGPMKVSFKIYTPSNPGGSRGGFSFSCNSGQVTACSGPELQRPAVPLEQVTPDWVKEIATEVLISALTSYRG